MGVESFCRGYCRRRKRVAAPELQALSTESLQLRPFFLLGWQRSKENPGREAHTERILRRDSGRADQSIQLSSILGRGGKSGEPERRHGLSVHAAVANRRRVLGAGPWSGGKAWLIYQWQTHPRAGAVQCVRPESRAAGPSIVPYLHLSSDLSIEPSAASTS